MTIRQPYSPSWVDHVINWIDGLPFPGFVFYAIFYLASVLFVHLAYWLEGALGFGELQSRFFFDLVWIPFGLGYLHLMRQIADQSIQEFRPAITVSKAEFEQIRYSFITLSFWPVLGLSVIGALSGIANYLQASQSFGDYAFVVLSGGGYTFLPVWLYAAYRQIIQISYLYKRVDSLNIFDLQPLYGLTRVSMFVGGFIIININMNYLWEVFLGTPSMSPQTIVLLSVALFVLAIIMFLVPLWGIHRKIENKKREMLAANAQQIIQVERSLSKEIQRNRYKNMDGLEKSLSALISLRSNISAVPAWPWSPGAFLRFASAIVLPILIWLLQGFLTRFFLTQ